MKPAHHFEQLHHVGGAEKVQAQHIARALGRGRDLVDVEIAGVRREDRALLHHLVQLAEDVLLDVHTLVHRLDHQIAVGEVAVFERWRQQAHRLLDLIGGHAAFLRGRFVVFAHRAGAPVERVLLHLEDGDGDACGQKVHRDPAAHRARADDADLLDVDQRGVGGNVVDLVRGALGEEIVPHRL